MKKTKNIKDTTEITKIKDRNITKTQYTRDGIDNVMGKLNKELFEFRIKYGNEPTLIIISKELEIIFREIMQLDTFHQVIGNNNKPIYTTIIFGVNCITSSRLSDLDFEVY